jgi:hypothetical protein
MKKITCKINDNITLELRKVVEVRGHDDSLPFNADIYAYRNGKKKAEYVGYAYNDGWGGQSVIKCENEDIKPTIQALDNELRTMKVPYVYNSKITYLPASLDFLIELMAEECLYDGVTEYDFNKNFVKVA